MGGSTIGRIIGVDVGVGKKVLIFILTLHLTFRCAIPVEMFMKYIMEI